MSDTGKQSRTHFSQRPLCTLSVASLLALGLITAAFAGSTKPAAPAGAAKAPVKARDLSGVWQVHVTGGLVGSSLLCQAVPELNQTQLDTVLKARNLKELFYAVVPDSARAWFDSVCEPIFEGDQVRGTCRIPLTYASPCGLIADLTFHGRLVGDTSFTGEGQAQVNTGGPGLCPEATCPGELRVIARRIGDVPSSATPKP